MDEKKVLDRLKTMAENSNVKVVFGPHKINPTASEPILIDFEAGGGLRRGELYIAAAKQRPPSKIDVVLDYPNLVVIDSLPNTGQ